jgi:PAS domain S-box-containing protein
LINRAAEKYLGVDRSAMLGKTVADVMPPSSAQMIEAEDRKVIASGQTSFCDEHTMQTPGNGTRIVTATRLTVKEDGRPQYLISVINDLTERKRNEQRIEHLAHHDALTDFPIAPRSTSASFPRSDWRRFRMRALRCFAWILTASSRSMTCSAMPWATPCCAR